MNKLSSTFIKIQTFFKKKPFGFTSTEPFNNNPFLKGQAHWNDLFESVTQRLINAQRINRILVGLLLVSLFGLISLGKQSKSQPYLIKVSSTGELISTEKIQALNLNDQVIAAALKEYLINLRSVSADNIVQKNRLRHVYFQTKHPAFKIIKEFIETFAHFERAKNSTNEIHIQYAMKIGQKTWKIGWQETQRSLMGEVQNREEYTAEITYTLAEIDSNQINENPLGLYVKQIAWSKVL